ncbi:MAG: YcxB family protein [Pseudomonadota bacterium]
MQRALTPLFFRWYILLPVLYYTLWLGGRNLSRIRYATPSELRADLIALIAVGFLVWGAKALGLHLAWRNNQKYQDEVNGYADAIGIEWNAVYSSTRFPWAKLRRAKQVPEMSLVYYSRNCAFYFPRQFFRTAEDWDAFQTLLRDRIGQEKFQSSRPLS